MSAILAKLERAEEAVVAGATKMAELAKDVDSVKMEWKEDKSMVLSLDLASQEEIGRILADDVVVSEEDANSHALIGKEQSYYVVDPLDGTHSCRRMLKNHRSFVSGQVGFGPMIGLVEGGKLVGATFLSLTEKKLYTALVGYGAYETDWQTGKMLQPFLQRRKLIVEHAVPLKESAVLYYPGKRGEMELVRRLREYDIVENVYRFGGFANDCTRIARGYEQLHVQLSLKAWDLSSALFATEAGFCAIMDPEGSRVKLSEWNLQSVNPLLLAHKEVIDEVMQKLFTK